MGRRGETETRGMNRKLKFALAAAVVLAVWALIAPSLANYLIVERPLPNADAIIVLSGSAAYKERTQKAAELYKRGVAPRIFITNDGGRAGWSRDERKNSPYVELEQRELIANGVAPDAITVLPGEVFGTDDEATVLAAAIEVNPIHSLVIVTSAYHTRRALRTFEKILGGKGVDIGIEHASIGESNPKPEFWWLRLSGCQTVGAEYLKSAVYWAYY